MEVVKRCLAQTEDIWEYIFYNKSVQGKINIYCSGSQSGTISIYLSFENIILLKWYIYLYIYNL